MLAGLVSPTDFSGGQFSWNITKPAESPPESTGKSNGIHRKVQWNPSESPTDHKQTGLLIIIINKKSDMNK